MLSASAWLAADQNNSAASLSVIGTSYTPSENMLEINKK